MNSVADLMKTAVSDKSPVYTEEGDDLFGSRHLKPKPY